MTSSCKQLDDSKPENVNYHFCKNILDMAKSANKKTILISSLLPYDVSYYDADYKYICYNPNGISVIPKEYNGEVVKYSTNVSAAVYAALGGYEPAGVCPVKF